MPVVASETRDRMASLFEQAFVVAGLGFGDEGKGSVVDWLVRRHSAGLVVRYNGGPQAAHHVVTSDGRTHCFAQLGAGMLVPGVRTHLSRFMVIDPLALRAEAAALERHGVAAPLARVTADPRCVVVTPFHRLLNQMQELARGAARHGSCGRGVAQAMLDAERPGLPVIRLDDARRPAHLRDLLRLLWHVKIDQAEQLVDTHPDAPGIAERLSDLRRPERLEALAEAIEGAISDAAGGITVAEAPAPARVAVFEGAQGVLLDRDHGFWPHVTPSRTTFAQAMHLIDEWAPSSALMRIGVLRAFATRHGAGPLPTEDPRLAESLPEPHNGNDPWQGPFRVGWFDGALTRHALGVCQSVDGLVLTWMDRLPAERAIRVATRYDAGLLDEPAPAGDNQETRAALTASLAAARPLWRQVSFSADPTARARELLAAAEVIAPLAAISVGPTAEAKIALPGVLAGI